MNLTKEQEEFVRQYDVDLNPFNAIQRMGVDELIAHATMTEMLNSPDVQDAMRLRSLAHSKLPQKDMTADDMGITPNYILLRLKRLSETAKQTDAIKALELMGKHLGMFKADTLQDSTDAPVFSPEERQKLLQRMKQNGLPTPAE